MACPVIPLSRLLFDFHLASISILIYLSFYCANFSNCSILGLKITKIGIIGPSRTHELKEAHIEILISVIITTNIL